MKLEVDILFTVLFRHTYFSSAKLECLTVTPTNDSLQAIRNNGLFFKSFKDGFRILYDTTQAGRYRERSALLGKNLSLRFTLALNDSSFYNYTSVTTDNIKDTVFYFNNTFTNNSSGKPDDLLHQDAFVSEKDLLGLDAIGQDFFVKPFGILDLELSASLKTEHSIRFDKKNTYWRYIVVGDHLKSLSSPAILDTNNLAAFHSPEKIALPDKREALLFTSIAPISLAEKPDALFQLVENYEAGSGKHKVVKKALPVPDVRSVSSSTGEKKSNYSEIFIY